MKIRGFTDKYLTHLKEKIRSGEGIGLYSQDKFSIDKSGITKSEEFEYQDDIFLKLPNEDGYKFENSKMVYESLRDLPRHMAADERVWAYLTHVDCWEYMLEVRGKRLDSITNKEKYILDHWFVPRKNQKALTRNDIAFYWWAAKLTYEEDRDDPYELTEEFVSMKDYSRSLLGGVQGRQEDFLKGLIELVIENKQLFDYKKEDKIRFLMREANRVGSYKNFRSLDRDEIKNFFIKIIKKSGRDYFDQNNISNLQYTEIKMPKRQRVEDVSYKKRDKKKKSEESKEVDSGSIESEEKAGESSEWWNNEFYESCVNPGCKTKKIPNYKDGLCESCHPKGKPRGERRKKMIDRAAHRCEKCGKKLEDEVGFMGDRPYLTDKFKEGINFEVLCSSCFSDGAEGEFLSRGQKFNRMTKVSEQGVGFCRKGHPLRLKSSRKGGIFLGCSKYPDCHEIFGIDKRLLVRLFGKEYLKCEECGSEMDLKYSGKNNSNFLGCSAYPDCKNTRNLMD